MKKKPVQIEKHRCSHEQQSSNADRAHMPGAAMPGAAMPGAASEPPLPAVQSTASVRLLLTPQEAAQALAINRSTLYELLMREEIPSILIGRARRIPIRALEEWIEQRLSA